LNNLDQWTTALQPFGPLEKPVVVNDVIIGDGGLVLIAGPCAIESEDLCLSVADQLAQVCSELGIGYIFKSSFDKANRTSIDSFRSNGIDNGLRILRRVKETVGVPLLTDVHETSQVKMVAEIVDVLQIPAFLSRQTDLLIESGKYGKVVNIKKGQFMAPADMSYAVAKVSSTGNQNVFVTERGALFGYRDLVVDMRSLVIMRSLGIPVVFDATHSVQQMGGAGGSSGGLTEFIPAQVRGAVAVGIDALFVETHPDPNAALSDGSTMVPTDKMRELLEMALAVHASHGY